MKRRKAKVRPEGRPIARHELVREAGRLAPQTEAPACRLPGTMRVTHWRPLRRGALRGFCTVHWEAAGLVFEGVAIFCAHGKAWAGLPAAPELNSSGEHLVIDGKRQYRQPVYWADRTRSDAFSARVIELLLRRIPDALDEPERELAS